MSWTIYLLSICDSIASIRFIVLVVFLICFVGWCICLGCTTEKTSGGEYEEPRKRDDLERARAWKSSVYLRRGWVTALIVGTITLLFPTQQQVLRAYMMVEGAKVVTAPNAEKALAEFTKRVDAIIGKINEGDK